MVGAEHDQSRLVLHGRREWWRRRGLLIALILILMLRSLVAPLYLMGGVVPGFLATLGAAVMVFQTWLGEPRRAITHAARRSRPPA